MNSTKINYFYPIAMIFGVFASIFLTNSLEIKRVPQKGYYKQTPRDLRPPMEWRSLDASIFETDFVISEKVKEHRHSEEWELLQYSDFGVICALESYDDYDEETIRRRFYPQNQYHRGILSPPFCDCGMPMW